MKIIKKDEDIYKKWKKITDAMYAGMINDKVATDLIIQLINKQGVNLRSKEQRLIAKSYFVYDKDRYADSKRGKPLGLGLIYEKPNGIKTQDIIIVSPEGSLDRFYSESEMIKKYPAMGGTHKNNLPNVIYG